MAIFSTLFRADLEIAARKIWSNVLTIRIKKLYSRPTKTKQHYSKSMNIIYLIYKIKAKVRF